MGRRYASVVPVECTAAWAESALAWSWSNRVAGADHLDSVAYFAALGFVESARPSTGFDGMIRLRRNVGAPTSRRSRHLPLTLLMLLEPAYRVHTALCMEIVGYIALAVILFALSHAIQRRE